MKNNYRFFFCTCFMFFSSNVFAAWDGVTVGKISSLDVTSGNNYGFRINLKGAPKLCGNNHTWAYVNESHSNYKTYVSVLLAAKMADKEVVLYTNQEQKSGANYCSIGYLVLK
ncbi:hypothetical protein AAOGI_40270 [Agarivorans albus]